MSTADTRTDRYRQQAALLASLATFQATVAPTTLVPSLVVAQALLERGHPGYVPTNMLAVDASAAGDDVPPPWLWKLADHSPEDISKSYLPCCQTCAAPLFVGLAGSQLRLERRSRGRRRNQRRQDLSQLGHFVTEQPFMSGARHVGVLTCGTCGCHAEVPGLPHRSPPPPQPTTKAPPIQPVAQKRPARDDLGSDFVRLAPGKKKKKKGKQLLEFLSSLND